MQSGYSMSSNKADLNSAVLASVQKIFNIILEIVEWGYTSTLKSAKKVQKNREISFHQKKTAKKLSLI